ncbi:MAG: hypothetical protein AUG06_11315 [Actinobacteria bacterium 13_1_20CM_2_65_11]|nr:MAG: hypothetical protein AUJ02_03360 [Chloroflexi bacterium 13_1_40CM_3_65_12]OLE78259.1 MAG: hypothetical protein AUG06_11315 [Actinobacteria bacterium 13_1_20CM_2_65_11]
MTTVRTAARRRGAARRAAGFGAGAFAVALRVAGRRAVRRVAGRDDADRAMFCTCLLNASRRFNAFSRSTWLAVRSRRVRSCLTALSSVFWPSLIPRSICLRTSGGRRLSAWRRYDRPALTARFNNLDCDDARFLGAMPNLPL